MGGNNSQEYDNYLFLAIYLKGNKKKIAEGFEMQNVPVSMGLRSALNKQENPSFVYHEKLKPWGVWISSWVQM